MHFSFFLLILGSLVCTSCYLICVIYHFARHITCVLQIQWPHSCCDSLQTVNATAVFLGLTIHTYKHLHTFGAFENFTFNIVVYQFRFRMWFHIRAKHRKTKQNPQKNITTPRIDSDHLYYYTLPLRLLYEEDAMNELNTQRDLDDAHMRVVSSFVPATITYTLFICLFVCASTYELSDCENLCICGNFRNQNKSVIHDCHFVTNKLNFPISIYFSSFFLPSISEAAYRCAGKDSRTEGRKPERKKEKKKVMACVLYVCSFYRDCLCKHGTTTTSATSSEMIGSLLKVERKSTNWFVFWMLLRVVQAYCTWGSSPNQQNKAQGKECTWEKMSNSTLC